jgi:hypothetical protein
MDYRAASRAVSGITTPKNYAACPAFYICYKRRMRGKPRFFPRQYEIVEKGGRVAPKGRIETTYPVFFSDFNLYVKRGKPRFFPRQYEIAEKDGRVAPKGRIETTYPVFFSDFNLNVERGKPRFPRLLTMEKQGQATGYYHPAPGLSAEGKRKRDKWDRM